MSKISATNSHLLPSELPDGREIIEEGRALAAEIQMQPSLLCKEHGVRSELQYKKKMVAEGRLMTTLNIGLQTWAETERALELIYAESERRGFRIDRYQMQVDRRMGVPPESRLRAAKETGPMLETPHDWLATAQTVPIQPQLGDMMIGSPMSVENATRALEAGVTYIGNMSQFSWKYPGWRGTDADQMIEMVRALGIMSAKAPADAVVQSYLDDGFPAQFVMYSSYVGWAMFEKYVVKQVIGANLSTAFGGLTHDPVLKSAVILALEDVKPPGMCNSFYHCNTTAYKPMIEQNYAILSVDVLYLMLLQYRLGTGAAVLPIPVTEALRIPSWTEVVDAHTVARRVADYAPNLADTINWAHLDAIKESLLHHGRRFFERLMEGLATYGIDMEDPLQLLLGVRRLGAVRIEKEFGDVSQRDLVLNQGHEKTALELQRFVTDTAQDFMKERDQLRRHFTGVGLVKSVTDRVVVASTDVHEYAINLIADSFASLGRDVVVGGISVDPDELADLALEIDATAVLVSTHNGMALTYGQRLLKELADRELSPVVVFGGTLNQDFDGLDTPVDVSAQLRKLGIRICRDVKDLFDVLTVTTAA